MQDCENVHVVDDRAVLKDGLTYPDPVMGQGIIEFNPSLADVTKSNLCAAMNEKGMPNQVFFSITDLECSGTNGLIEGFVKIENGSSEKRIRSTSVATYSGILMTAICVSALNNAMSNLVAEVLTTVSTTE
jgi:hypothetical protein